MEEEWTKQKPKTYEELIANPDSCKFSECENLSPLCELNIVMEDNVILDKVPLLTDLRMSSHEVTDSIQAFASIDAQI